ncbi:hypothetical protein Mgra_00009758 [Meloidogyne graminicola]|uniref:ATP synthase subunit O, mitochondrial n=1 Tax=Meloidogyne graminicola TaxID=189291 RepID=A0A8S9ZBI3_9BILA|nr:hypothetical protein Mgra_00009758 [Meloidogyne graminicola]
MSLWTFARIASKLRYITSCPTFITARNHVSIRSLHSSSTNFAAATAGKVHVEIITAEPLNEEQERSLRDALTGFASAGNELNISFGVKPSLIGRMVITIDDKYLDLSMASKIKEMEAVLRNAI